MSMHRKLTGRGRGLLFAFLASAGVGASAASAESGLVDPTRPALGVGAVSAPADGGALTLQSTLISPRRRVAVINGRSYTVGERVDGARILAIEPYAVRLDTAQGGRTLRLLPRVKKTGSRVENSDAKP
jgi:MSHA biogenesis protein MshK